MLNVVTCVVIVFYAHWIAWCVALLLCVVCCVVRALLRVVCGVHLRCMVCEVRLMLHRACCVCCVVCCECVVVVACRVCCVLCVVCVVCVALSLCFSSWVCVRCFEHCVVLRRL